MLSNLLYGPAQVTTDTQIVLRSMTFDIDVVRDVFQVVNEKVGPARLIINDPLGEFEREADIATIDKLADSELRRVIVRSGTDSNFFVEFREGTQPFVGFSVQNSSTGRDVARFLLAEGKPRIAWPLFRLWPAAGWFFVLAIVGLATLWLNSFETWSQNLLVAGLILAGAFFAGDSVQRRQDIRHQREPRVHRGHRVKAVTRASVRLARAQQHRDFKVGAATGLIGAAAGAILTAILT